MSDLISRQAAIDAIVQYLGRIHRDFDNWKGTARIILDHVPSAQPEQPSEIQDEIRDDIQVIFSYLDTVLHPIVSPEHWTVYSELHDMISTLQSTMISTLQSAQPERKPGRWICGDTGLMVTEYKCSECGRTVRDDTGYDVCKDYPYCHCGAEMLKEGEG